MKRTLEALILMALAYLILVRCSNQGATVSPINTSELDTLEYVDTPTDGYEAETASYFLGETRIARKYLYEKIRADLGLIRSKHDSVVGVNVKHTPYAFPSYLLLLFDSVVTESIRSGEYHSWDSLNGICMLDTFEINRGYVEMQFEGIQNPMVLFDIYKDLPGLWHISTSGRAGDWPVLAMIREGKTIKYFFREAWGDCYCGCIFSRFSYFTVSDSQVTYHGSFQNRSCDGTELPPPPEWADTTWQALHDYHQYAAWSHDTLRPPTYPCDTISLDLPEVHRVPGTMEAKLIALCLSRELNPLQDLVKRASSDLEWIRQNRPDSIVAIDSIEFRSPWNPRGFSGYWNPEEMNDSSGLSYWPFKCIREHLGVPWVQEGSNGWFSLHSGGTSDPLHPCAIIEEFKKVPAITRMKAQVRTDIESDIYVAMSTDTFHYFFRHAWGRLLTTPDFHYENEEFFYFRSTSDSTEYVGGYNPEDSPSPEWYTYGQHTRSKKYEQPCEWSRPD